MAANTATDYYVSFVGFGKVAHAIIADTKVTMCGKDGSSSTDQRRYRPDGNPACKACAKKVAAITTDGEKATMTPTAAEKHATTREEITANMERVRSLAEAENTEGAEALSKETDGLIASLPAKERTKLRADLRKAATAAPQTVIVPAPQAAEVATLETANYADAEGVSDLVDLGAAKVTESVNLHLKGSQSAKAVAAVILDIRRRLTNKEGYPDLSARSDAAKKAASAMYQAAGAQITGDAYDVEESVKKMRRAVQLQMSDVMAEYLRGLDDSEEEAAHFAKIMEGQPEGTKVSQAVADHYGLKLKGQIELAREKYQAAKELEAASGEGAEGEGAEGEGEEAEGTETAESTPDERVEATVKKIMKDLKAAKPEDFEQASEEAKGAARKSLEEASKALKAMIAATL